jgi:hypothetical protein
VLRSVVERLWRWCDGQLPRQQGVDEHSSAFFTHVSGRDVLTSPSAFGHDGDDGGDDEAFLRGLFGGASDSSRCMSTRDTQMRCS